MDTRRDFIKKATRITEHAYGASPMRRTVPAANADASTTVAIDTRAGQRWYDSSVFVPGFPRL